MDKFCSAPWVNRFVHPDGRLAPCCFANTSNEQDIQDLKQSFLLDQQDERCQFCWHNERRNLSSLRQTAYQHVIKIHESSQIKNLQINLGNYCNAECIMCNGNTSSSRNSWAKKYDKIHFARDAVSLLDTSILEFDLYPELEMVTLLGGEPTIHPSTRPLLQKLINSGQAKNIDINFNTNSSILDKKLIETLKQFRDIFVTLSLDSAGRYFEYQRRPLEWNTAKEIAKQWISISHHIEICYVVTAISIWGFNQFIDWYTTELTREEQCKVSVKFDHAFGATASAWSVAVLTDQQKQQWLDTAVDHPLTQEIRKIIDNISHNPLLLSVFAKQISKEDSTAKIKFAEIFPNWNINGKT